MKTRYEFYPAIKLDHLYCMTDDTGMLQHAFYHIPQREHGYCTDDNARALITTVLLMKLRPLPHVDGLALKYMSFLEHALDKDSGLFRNFLAFDRQWTEKAGSEDSHGRAVWALGMASSLTGASGLSSAARYVFEQSLSAIENFHSLRARAFAMIGISAYLQRFRENGPTTELLESLAKKMRRDYDSHAALEWPWPDECLTYSNGKIAQAMIYAGRALGRPELTETGLETLYWLMKMQTGDWGYFAPIGNDGWYYRNRPRARFDQQPVEAQAMTDACLSAFEATGDDHWIAMARLCFEWFLGRNDLDVPLYDPTTGGCCDGLSEKGSNSNQGAESTLSWLISRLMIQMLDDRLEPERTHFWFS